MYHFDNKFALTYDDIMLVPIHSAITSRKQPKTTTMVGKNIQLDIPIIAAPMNTVAESRMAEELAQIGAGTVIHRYMSIVDQITHFVEIQQNPLVWAAVGATGDYFQRVEALIDVGVSRFCIDVANGHSEICLKAVEKIASTYNVEIMAGNVCTGDGARRLEEAGATSIRVGIGPGSVCTTRLVTGFGVPQVTAIQWCADEVKNASIVADGGIRSSGDIVKALALGADAVMVGGLLAGTDQSPGKTERDDSGRLYKHYHGMASSEGRKEWFDKEATSYVPEGTSMKVWHKGCAVKIVQQLNNSIKVGMSFANSLTLKDLRSNAKFIRITDNGRKEANPNAKMFGGSK